ncbi:helix-turn-helix domain-containing protein [Mycobacterium sp. Marseille-P9652]|uniref:helix-turn-helix domain-containing protein n=1 Tax=Mycobacterium sp. Marseille-P9652 TaxID=2654950 RepID=UPI001E2FBDB5|nr:helix-turn-helix transcriptional regulator [Mycobacterium sp. Marseille-P9652]
MLALVEAEDWPLLRREPEFAAVHAALTERSRTAGVVVVGAAGVGKTTLARDVADSLPERVRWVAGTASSRSIPLGPFTYLVGAGTARDPTAYLAAARDALTADRGAVLGVDDAHLLDDLSATLVLQLALERSVPMVANVRANEPVPDAITSLWKDRYLRRVELRPFTRDQCAELVERVLGGPVEGLSVDVMWQDSGGNALFLRNLVEGAVEAGTLRQVRGIWQLRGPAVVRDELAALVDERVEQLPEDVTHALGLLAICEPLDLDTLIGLTGAGAVEQAERRGLIRITDEREVSEVQFNQLLLSDVMRRRIGVAAGRRLRGELVDALAAKPLRGPGERIRLAGLTLDSDAHADPELLVAAADDAIALTDVTLGERLARAAVDRGAGPAAGELLARSLLWQGRAAEADQALSAYDPDAMDEEQVLGWGVVRVANLQLSAGDADAADDVLAVLRRRIADPGLRLVVDGLAAASLALENRLADAAELSRRVLADPASSPDALGWALVGGGFAWAFTGRGDQLTALAERARRDERGVDGVLRHLMAYAEVWALVLTGEFDAAETRLAGGDQIFSMHQYLDWGLDNMAAGTVDLARGRFAAAASRMEQTVAALTTKSAAWWSVPRMSLAQAYCGLGRAEAAAATIDELNSRAGAHRAVFGPQLRLLDAWLAAARGDTRGAIAAAIDAADSARRCGQCAIEMLALHDAARFGGREWLQRLIDVAESVDGRLAPAHAADGAALRDRDPVALCAASERFERIGAMLSAADTAAQAAELFGRRDDRRRATEAVVRADRIAAAAGGMRSPALAAAATPLPLTSRERDVANLVASGLTSREIAERLSLSARTVEGHVLHACTKLGVADRKALAEFMRRGART